MRRMGRLSAALAGLWLLVCAGWVPGEAAGAGGSWQVLGAARSTPDFYGPAGVAVDARGQLYVADTGNARVVKLSSSGRVLAVLSVPGWAQGSLGALSSLSPTSRAYALGPTSLAVTPGGLVYAADPINHRVDRFAPDGHSLAPWDVMLSGANPTALAVAVGRQGAVTVAIAARVICPSSCASFYIVQRRAADGRVLAQWRSSSPPTRPQRNPPVIQRIAVTLDHRDNAYVSVQGALECHKGCPSFAYVDTWSPAGRRVQHRDGSRFLPSGIVPVLAIGGRGNVFTAPANGFGVVKFSASGRVLARWHPRFSGPAPFSGPEGVAVDARGRVYLTDSAYGRVFVLSPDGRTLTEWGAGGRAAGRFWTPDALARDPRGRLWVLDTGNRRIQILTVTGRPVTELYLPGLESGQALAFDAAGNAYIGQVRNHQVFILKLSVHGQVVARWGSFHLASPPTGMAVDSRGDIYALADFSYPPSHPYTDNGLHLLKLSPQGRKLAVLPVQTHSRAELARDPQGNLYVLGSYDGTVEKLGANGHVLARWGGAGTAPGLFKEPEGITIDQAGDVYITDLGNDRIQKFSSGGVLLAVLGATGAGPGEFHQPSGIAVDSQGDLFVADAGNQRLQRYTP